MNKKIIIFIFVALIVFLLGFIAVFRMLTPEDTWVCKDGTWIEHGKPDNQAPNLPCR